MESQNDIKMTKEELNKSELMNMKDCKSMADFSFEKIEMMRGTTPQDINQKCLKLCQDYLAGIWLKQTEDTIKVKRITGGMTNQLYYCAIAGDINSNMSVSEGVPHEVAIRLYGTKHYNKDGSNGRLTDVITAVMVSENKLGPKVYGIFKEGEIQAYHKVCIYKNILDHN